MHRIAFMAVTLSSSIASAESYFVDPDVGNSSFHAVFDAKLGERIHAMSSAIACDATYDEKAGTVSGVCSVPLTTIKVDNEDTKTEHFQQWATNKKMAPKDCKLEVRFTSVQLGKLVPEKPVEFTAQVPFTICGKARADGGKETLRGSAILFPPGSYGEAKTIRVRGTVEGFNRDKYKIGPGHTEGWLARVQSLAKVVADEGTIELSLFAKLKSSS